MTGEADLARIGSLLADRTRVTMLLALLAGRPMAASALADASGVSPSLASAHLRKLVDGGLLVVEPMGRQRLFRLATSVADALEALLLLAPPDQVSSLRGAVRGRNLRRARMCYDHLAGTVGVAVSEAMVRRGLLTEEPDEYRLTPAGALDLERLGIRVTSLERHRRPLARRCMDWSERRAHLAGSLGAGVAAALLDQKWLRPAGRGRGLTVTSQGEQSLRSVFGITLGSPEPRA